MGRIIVASPGHGLIMGGKSRRGLQMRRERIRRRPGRRAGPRRGAALPGGGGLVQVTKTTVVPMVRGGFLMNWGQNW